MNDQLTAGFAPEEAERHIAGCLLVRPRETVADIRKVVNVQDFSISLCRDIYRAVLELLDDNAVIDPVTVQEKMETYGRAIKTELLKEYMMTFATTASVVKHAEIVHRAAVKRSASTICLRCATGDISLEKCIADLQTLQMNTAAEGLTPAEMVQRFADYVLAVDSGDKIPFLPTGFKLFDEVLGGGLVDGGLITVAARPGTGKTTFALNLAQMLSGTGRSVLYISLEMPYMQLLARRVGILTGLSFGKILKGGMDEKEWVRFTNAEEIIARENFTIIDKPCTVDDIERYIRTSPVDLTIIDHIGLISNPKGGSRYEFMTDTTHRLKQIALSTGRPILALCQLNRIAESRQDKRPSVADLRDSGAIEEDSDVVGLLYREAMYLPEDKRPKPWETQYIDCIIGKNRHGMQAVVPFAFCGINARMREV